MERLGEKRWLIPTTVLCCYGFLKEVRPSESFLTPYLRQDKNLTEEEVNNQVYPVWTYTYLFALIFVFLVTDLLRYKPVIIFEGAAYIGTWCLLLWAYGVNMMKLMQFIYAFATSTEVAYYAYIFAAVSADHYQQVSSYTRSSLLMGRFIAAILGQLLISFHVMDYRGLNYISLSCVSLGFVVSFFLPAVKRKSQYFRRDMTDVGNSAPENLVENQSQVFHSRTVGSCSEDNSTEANLSSSNWRPSLNSVKGRMSSVCSSTKEFAHNLWTDFKCCYSNQDLLEWSLWWAFATCGNMQIGNYIQNLWDLVFTKNGDENDVQNVYNGAADALSTLLGAICAFLIMFPKVDWDRYGALLLGLVSILDSILLVIMGLTTNIWLCYAFYIIFRSSYQLVITIATFQIAKHLVVERYALVFGWNMFVALVLETILTVILVDYRTLDLPADTQKKWGFAPWVHGVISQFLVYGGYFYLLGTAFSIKAAYQSGQIGCRRTLSCCHGDDGTCLVLQERELMEATGEEGSVEENERERTEGECERREEEEHERIAKEIDDVMGGDEIQFVN